MGYEEEIRVKSGDGGVTEVKEKEQCLNVVAGICLSYLSLSNESPSTKCLKRMILSLIVWIEWQLHMVSGGELGWLQSSGINQAITSNRTRSIVGI